MFRTDHAMTINSGRAIRASGLSASLPAGDQGYVACAKN